MVPSWRQKVARAQHHLGDLSSRFAPIEENRVHDVSEGLEAQDDGEIYVHRVVVPGVDDPMAPVIVGELMFNLRSALDHLAVAMVHPDQRTRKTAFPIFTDDIHEMDPATGKHLQPGARKRWRAMTRGFPHAAMPTVEMVQPYNLRRHGKNPKHVSLAQLSTFQNADKHNQLLVVPSGITALRASFIGPTGPVPIDHDAVPDGYVVGHGAQVGATSEPLPPDVKVQIEGTLTVQIGDGLSGDYLPCIEALEGMITDTTGVLDLLEPFAKHRPDLPELL
jgi:hypothetical protein